MGVAKYAKITICCLTCNKEFKITENLLNRKKYCSKQCYTNKPKSIKKPFIKICEYCKKEFNVSEHDFNSERKRFCSRRCSFDSMKVEKIIINCEVCNKEFTKFINGSQRVCSRKCATKLPKKEFHLSEEHRQIVSETRKRDWADGKYKNHRVGKTKWYKFIKSNDEEINCQGTWEFAYAKYLDEQNINFKTHEGAIWYTRSSDNSKRVYLPDFYLIDIDEYHDVKNDYLLNVVDKQKIEDVIKCNPEIKLRIITKEFLKLKNLI